MSPKRHPSFPASTAAAIPPLTTQFTQTRTHRHTNSQTNAQTDKLPNTQTYKHGPQASGSSPRNIPIIAIALALAIAVALVVVTVIAAAAARPTAIAIARFIKCRSVAAAAGPSPFFWKE